MQAMQAKGAAGDSRSCIDVELARERDSCCKDQSPWASACISSPGSFATLI